MMISSTTRTTTTSLLLLLLASLAVLTPTHASFPANTSSYFNIQIPYSAHVHNQTGGMMHHTARFGSHWDNFEGNLVVPVHDIEGDLCESLNKNQTKDLPDPPFFLLVNYNEKGGPGVCTPVTKARRAQEAGAAGMIMFHPRCLCEDEKNETCSQSDKKQCIHELPYLGEGDGNGKDIGIPSVLIPKQEGAKMKKELKDGKAVVVEMAWHWPKMNPSADPPEKVRLDFWHTPVDEHTQSFLSNMSFIVAQMQDTLEFHPHFFLLDGKAIQCFQHANQDTEQCYPMCSNNGRYCSWGSHGITGNQTITETLRRKCILKHYPELFWNYIDIFHTKCAHSKDFYTNPECIQDVYHHSGGKTKIDPTQIDDCIHDSGGLEADNENTLLQEELEWSQNSVTTTPNLWINFVPYRWGPLDPKWVLETICHGFVYGQAPHICHVCAHCGDPALCASRNPMSCQANDGVEPEPQKKHHGKKSKAGRFFLHFFWFTLLVGGVGAGFLYYKRNYMEEGVGVGGPGGGYQNLGMALMSDRT